MGVSIEKALFERLKAHVPLVGNRVFGGDASPQEVAKPCLIFRVEGTERQYTHQGYADLQQTTVLIYGLAVGYEAVNGIADQVIQAIESWSAAGIQAPFVRDKSDLYFYDLKLFGCLIRAELWHST